MLQSKVFRSLLLASIFMIVVTGFYFYPQLSIATGYAAKKVCTCTLATGRALEEVEHNDLYFNILTIVRNKINSDNASVTSSIFGLAPQTAVYKPGIGCILLNGVDDYHVVFPKYFAPTDSKVDTAFSVVKKMTTGIDSIGLLAAVADAFDADDRLDHKRTTAVVVIHRDTLVAERYSKPFDVNTPQLGWSMTKSLMNTFAGLLVYEGKITQDQQPLFEVWKKDARKQITLTHMLQMNSGLEWEEDYTSVSDATSMLYKSEDVSAIALQKPLSHDPGKYWYYSSGTSNLLSRYFRNIIGNDEAYHIYLKEKLFDVIGMHTAFIETDETGTFIGSSYGYATPRDWAKFGLLYLHDGVWKGRRILPQNWVAFSRTGATGSNGKYGAQFWLNQKGIQYPDAPNDMLIADGYQGQFVFIIPSHDAVIVRMGTGGEHFDPNIFMKNILAALPKSKIK
jgi:CubicO group peptidase (beta-lactamase class C family)